MAKLADARDSKSRDSDIMSVRVRLPAPKKFTEWRMIEENCVFCKIINKQLPAKLIAENDTVLVIQDISPKSPIHYLIIPKKHIENIQVLAPEDKPLVGEVLFMAKELSKSLPKDGAFRLLSNNGATVGQSVFHLHFHFLSGKVMVDF